MNIRKLIDKLETLARLHGEDQIVQIPMQDSELYYSNDVVAVWKGSRDDNTVQIECSKE